MKPVLYLDVDGVLWDLPRNDNGVIHSGEPIGARGVEEFIDFAHQHFAVRWITTWAMAGFMRPSTFHKLVEYTGVPRHKWARVGRSKGFRRHKHECIDVEEHKAGRPFVWVEDGLTPAEHTWLQANGWEDRYFYTNVFKDPDALLKTLAALREWIHDHS